MTRRPLVLCLLVAALAAPTAAQAAPKGGGGGAYSVVGTYDHVSCTTGATCTASGSATTAGALSGKSSYSRAEVGDSDRHEAGVGGAVHAVSLPVPAGATTVTVTASWSLDIAVAASSSSGTTYGAVSARVRVPQCEGSGASCTATLTPGSDERVRWVYDMPDRPHSAGQDGPQTVTLSMKVEGSLPTSLTIQPDVQAAAGGYPDCVLLVPCLAGQGKPQGTSSASFSGTLKSVSLTAG